MILAGVKSHKETFHFVAVNPAKSDCCAAMWLLANQAEITESLLILKSLTVLVYSSGWNHL